MTDRVKNWGDSDTIEGLYRAIRDGRPGALEGRCLIALRHWFQDLAAFDELTGQAMPEPLSALCERLTAWPSPSLDACCQDRLHRILEHVRHPLPELFKRLGERRLRDHAMLPIQAVRELDSRSLSALGRRPGRTIREKLADKPYLMAVRRRATVDTTENRLLKTLCLRLSELLAARAECFGIYESQENKELFQAIESWLRTPEADEIGRWENLPPNNVLLQHRSYRRLWNAWRWGQALDSDVQRDRETWHEQWAMTVFWTILARLDGQRRVRLPEQPCFLDYDRLRIRPARCPGEFVASVEGLIFPHVPPGHLTGFVTRKTDKGFGFARTAGLEKVFFHISEFVTRTDFDLACEGTALRFALEQTERGWEARDVYPATLVFALSLALAPRPDINLAFQNGNQRVLVSFGEPHGSNLRVTVGKIAATVKMSPQGAAYVAELAVSSLLPENDPFVRAAVVPRHSDHAVVDLAALRPRFADPAGTGTMPFRLLWQLWRLPEQDAKDIDLAYCRAAALDPYATTVSVLDLLAAKQDQRLDRGTLGQAAKAFSGRIADFLKTKSLTYLLPDAADDFSLETIRTNVNAWFPGAQPLPRSIAAVFDWQSSDAFADSRVQQGDVVVVLDTAGDDFCATPVMACHREELARAVPATCGISWERCPPIQGDSELSSVSSAIRALQKSGCTFPHTVGRLCGLQGILDEADGVSWLGKDNTWFTASPELAECCRAARASARDPWSGLARGLELLLREIPTKGRLFFLAIGDAHGDNVGLPPPAVLNGRRAAWLPPCRQPARGGMVLRQWQAIAGDMALWRDHLPELSVRIERDGRYTLFYLVKDVAVVPKRGVPVPIPIKEMFTLGAGQTHYEFPLSQGVEGNELRYQVYLKSPAFPLHTPVPCRLVMTFTYGEDEPYQLVFIPLDARTAGFTSVRAQWQPKLDSIQEDSLWPPFPPRKTWSDLRAFSRGTEAKRDLILQMEQALDLSPILQAAAELETARQWVYPQRAKGVMKTSWKQGGYCFLETQNDDVFCHISSFCEATSEDAPQPGDTVFFDPVQDEQGRWRTENASFTQEAPSGLAAARQQEFVNRAIATAWESERSLRSVRFAVLTAWDHGHHVGEDDAPLNLRAAVDRIKSQSLEWIAWAERIADDAPVKAAFTGLADAVFFLLCSLSVDAPDDVYRVIEEMRPDDILRQWRRLAYVIGAAQNDRQRALFRRCLDLAASGDPIWMQILGIAVWRAPNLVHEIPGNLVERICRQLLSVLEQDANRVIREDPETHESFVAPYVVSRLELLLGLLRTRESRDERIRSILATGRPLATNLARAVDQIDERVCAAGLLFNTRITLNVEKKATLRTPDLLYALRLYLTGESDARTIQVAVVSDED